jgi:DNA-binding GntR family transcriptional regulator
VRTALTRLEQEGLVIREPHRGARVRRVTLDEAVEIVEARTVLEAMAARYAAARATAEELAGMRAVLVEMEGRLATGDLLGYSERNAHLHRQILAASRHRIAQRLVGGLKAQIVRYQFRTVFVPGRPEQSVAEHRHIIESIAARDEEAAEAAMREHLSHVTTAIRRTAAAQADLAPPVPAV